MRNPFSFLSGFRTHTHELRATLRLPGPGLELHSWQCGSSALASRPPAGPPQSFSLTPGVF